MSRRRDISSIEVYYCLRGRDVGVVSVVTGEGQLAA